MAKKKKAKFKKLNKKELKKVKGGVDIMEHILKHGFGEEQGEGTHFVIDISGVSRFGAGFKIKF
jgi:bacteriocin-like protein